MFFFLDVFRVFGSPKQLGQRHVEGYRGASFHLVNRSGLRCPDEEFAAALEKQMKEEEGGRGTAGAQHGHSRGTAGARPHPTIEETRATTQLYSEITLLRDSEIIDI